MSPGRGWETGERPAWDKPPWGQCGCPLLASTHSEGRATSQSLSTWPWQREKGRLQQSVPSEPGPPHPFPSCLAAQATVLRGEGQASARLSQPACSVGT